MSNQFLIRLSTISEKLKDFDLDVLVVSSGDNRRYLTSLVSSAGYVVITSQEAFLLVDSRYILAASKINNYQVLEINDFYFWWKDFVSKKGSLRVGFESHHLSYLHYKKLKVKGVKLTPADFILEELRNKKDEEEITLLKKSLAIAEKTFEHILSFIKPGLTELEVAWELEKSIRENGAEKTAWHPFIVAAGVGSAEPHHLPGKYKIKKGDMVQLDFGGVFEGYHSDISRVVFLGKPDEKQLRIYNLVLEVQEYAKSLIKENVETGFVDRKVKDYLHKFVESGWVFKHGLGHGLGLEIHEGPVLYTSRKEKFEAGNVITIEPAIYVPNFGGVRIEDEVLVTKNGIKTLNRATKKLEDVVI